MKITIAVPYLHMGENISRTLHLTGIPAADEEKSVRMTFVTPAGRTYISQELSVSERSCDCILSAELLDRYGRLLAQAVITDGQGYCLKSDIFDFEVRPGIDEMEAKTPDGRFITLADVEKRLCEAESIIAELARITEEEIDEICDEEET